MTNSVDPIETAPIGTVSSGSTLFASILKFVSNVRQLFAADDFSRHHFSDAFFLGALRVSVRSLFYFAVLNFVFVLSFAINSLRKRVLITLLLLCSECQIVVIVL